MGFVQSAVIVAVPDVESVVGSWRARLDPSVGWGVPAHVTVLYPFLPPEVIDAAVMDDLNSVIARVPAFVVTFSRTAWFGPKVLWLDPDPAEPFRELTTRVWRRFPQCPAYEGTHTDPVPHLTIGDDAPLPDMLTAQRSVAVALPIAARVSHAQLICGSFEPDSWRTVREFPLGP